MKDGLEFPLITLWMLKGTLLSPTIKKTNHLPLFRSSDPVLLMNFKKLTEPITKELSEKILNGTKMDQVPPQPLTPSISDFLDTIFIILKPMPMLLFWEPLVSTISSPPKEEPPTVSPFLMTNPITGPCVPSTEPPPPIGSAPFPKSLDYLAPKKEKEKPQSKRSWLNNLC